MVGWRYQGAHFRFFQNHHPGLLEDEHSCPLTGACARHLPDRAARQGTAECEYRFG